MCRKREDFDYSSASSGPSNVPLIVLGSVLGLAICLLLASGFAFKNWLPMINIAFVIAVPIAVILADAVGSVTDGGTYSEGKSAWANFSACLFGTIIISLFGLPLVLLHQTPPALDVGPFALWIASTVMIFGAAIYYWVSRQQAKNRLLGYS